MIAAPNRLSDRTLGTLRLDRPAYDRSTITCGIVHFGVGAHHRAHQAVYLDTLMNQGLAHDFGIVGVECATSRKGVVQALNSQDGLYTVAEETRGRAGRAHVVGSVQRVLFAPDEPDTVLRVMTDPATRIVSLTLGTGGWPIDEDTKGFDPGHPSVAADLKADTAPQGPLAFIIDALVRRREAGTPPFTVMSCDDLPGNGDIARRMIVALARTRAPADADWLDTSVPCPGSTVTVNAREIPATETGSLLGQYGILDACAVATDPYASWALEDEFPMGRPPYERAGVQLTDNVAPYGLLKLRLQESSRQAACYLGYLIGHRRAGEVAQDPLLTDFLQNYLRDEVVPTLPTIPGVDADALCQSLIARLRSDWGDEPLTRLCANGSDRIPMWLVPVIEDNVRARVPVECAALILASWARYVEGRDEQGAPIEVIDRLAAPLAEMATRQGDDPLVLLRNPFLFGGLIDTLEFTEPYRSALHSLHAVGARRTLENLMSATRR